SCIGAHALAALPLRSPGRPGGGGQGPESAPAARPPPRRARRPPYRAPVRIRTATGTRADRATRWGAGRPARRADKRQTDCEVSDVIAELLEGKRVCICAGSGGVGKTTVSAAIALGMAAQGSRVAVVTIDPANRLADALGVEGLDNELHQVVPGPHAPADLEVQGELWAMMLDPQRTV